ncbi:hypothetical protein AMECASPLE_033841 [Ameca splendens]|uniref:Secreted protein n=1 Tax=Ameca splendens TaxID=208324 RepID=A0ABV0XVS3_9TELE
MLVRLVQGAFWCLPRPAVPVSLSCLTSGRHNVRLRTIRGPARILSKVRSSCQSSRCVSTTGHSEDGILVYSGSLGTAVRGQLPEDFFDHFICRGWTQKY